MLLCADRSPYVGVTNDLEIRIGQHQFGFDRRCYTFRRRPVKLVHSSDFRNVDVAIAWEKQLKGWSRAKKVALIESDWVRIHDLAECKNLSAAVSPFDSAQGDTGGTA
jgi:putative endonuclease